jgi:hypothetical protein
MPMSLQPQARFGSLISMRRRSGVLRLSGTVFAALAATTTPCSAHQSLHVAIGATHGPAAPTSSATHHGVSTRVVPRCRAADVRVSVAKTASVMSQPFSDIALTSNRTTTCAISGYPRIRARGFLGEDRHGEPLALAISVHHGMYERVDPGPRRAVLRPHHPLFFSVGTATAYQGGLHPIMLTQLIAVLPGTHVPITVPIDLLATKPQDRKIPVGITAITASPHA